MRAGKIARVRCETAGAEELASNSPSVNRSNVFRALNLRSPGTVMISPTRITLMQGSFLYADF